MGSNISTISDLSSNMYIKRFSSSKRISEHDNFWLEFLQFEMSSSLNQNHFKALYIQLKVPLCNLSRNNGKSLNFTGFLKYLISNVSVFLSRTAIHFKNAILMHEITKSLLVLHIFLKYLAEHISEKDMMQYFVIPSIDTNYFLHSLMRIITDIPLTPATYMLIYETIRVLIAILARQLYNNFSGNLFAFHQYLILGNCSQKAPSLIRSLLNIFATNYPCKEIMLENRNGSNLKLWNAATAIASSIRAAFTIGYSDWTKQIEDRSFNDHELTHDGVNMKNKNSTALNPISRQASFLLLLLTTHSKVKIPTNSLTISYTYRLDKSKCENRNSTSDSNQAIIHNPYREALFELSNIEITNECFNKILVTACNSIELDSTILIIYLLIHRNSNFLVYILKDDNYAQLIIKLLEILYRNTHEKSHLTYMSLIILLILTENSYFIQQVHHIKLETLPWKLNKPMNDISMGSLIVFVLIRIVQNHLNDSRDRYLHINSLAALANMSSKITNLNQEVSNSLINLIVMLHRRHKKIEYRMQQPKSKNRESQVDGSHDFCSTVTSASHKLLEIKELCNELILYKEVIRTLLEVVNSITAHSLAANCQLIYTLLHQKDHLLALKNNPNFADLLSNIEIIASFYTQILSKSYDLTNVVLMPEEIMRLITKYVETLVKHQNIKKFPELKFKYVEESVCDEFFVPYVWLSIFTGELDYFNAALAKVFYV